MNTPTPTYSPPKCALLAINPKSLHGDEDRTSIINSLRENGVAVIDADTADPERLSALLAQHAGKIDCLIVGGGDGSMNALAAFLVDSGLPLGILPMGTANDLARTLDIPTDLEDAIGIIAQGVRHRIDLGQVNDRYFFNVANVGLGVKVSGNLTSEDKQRWKILSYARSLLRTLRSVRWFSAELHCDGQRWRLRSIQIAIGNGRHYGGGMTVLENARIDDGLFSFYSVNPVPFWDLLKLAPLFRSGRFTEAPPVDCGSGSRIELVTRKPMRITADGDPVTWTPATFVMRRGAIEVFVPIAYIHNQQEANHAA